MKSWFISIGCSGIRINLRRFLDFVKVIGYKKQVIIKLLALFLTLNEAAHEKTPGNWDNKHRHWYGTQTPNQNR